MRRRCPFWKETVWKRTRFDSSVAFCFQTKILNAKILRSSFGLPQIFVEEDQLNNLPEFPQFHDRRGGFVESACCACFSIRTHLFAKTSNFEIRNCKPRVMPCSLVKSVEVKTGLRNLLYQVRTKRWQYRWSKKCRLLVGPGETGVVGIVSRGVLVCGEGEVGGVEGRRSKWKKGETEKERGREEKGFWSTPIDERHPSKKWRRASSKVVVDVDGWRIERGEVRGWGESMFWWGLFFCF